MKWILLAGFMFTLMACGKNSPMEHSENRVPIDQAQAQIAYSGISTKVQCDSLVVQVSGADMETIRQSFPYISTDTVLSLDDLSPGVARLFEVLAYDSTGRLLYDGQTTMDLPGGQITNIQINLAPKFARVQAAFPVGIENPMQIAGGIFILKNGIDSMSVPLMGTTTPRTFTMEPVIFGEWELETEIWNVNGDTVYFLKDTLLVESSQQTYHLLLESLLNSAELEIQFLPVSLNSLQMDLPNTIRRTPQNSGDIILTQFLANPKVSGSDYEWMEFFNGSTDTLELIDCSIRKTRGSTSATTHLDFLDTIVLAPSELFVAGRDSVFFADVNYSSFTLSNSGQDIMLFCGETLLDSIHYNSATDTLNPFPLEEGRSLELNLEKWQNRNLGSSWNAGTQFFEYNNDFSAQGSPGEILTM